MFDWDKYPSRSLETLAGYTEDAASRRAFLRKQNWILIPSVSLFLGIIALSLAELVAFHAVWLLAAAGCMGAAFLSVRQAYMVPPRSSLTGRRMQAYRNSSAPAGVLEILYVDDESRTFFRHVFGVPPD